ncbi:MAG: hypothetical protein PHI28_08900 [Mangrovibacterium sp.]|nr:hypothetical protein [Mangrovibacterium sp.]
MRKIILPILIVFVVILALGAGWFLMQRQTRAYTENSAFKAVPVKTPLVVEMTDVQTFLQKLEQKGPLTDILRSVSGLQAFHDDVDRLSALLAGSERLRAMLTKKPALAAFNPVGKDHIGCLLALSLENRAEKSEMIGFIRDYSKNEAGNLTKRVYDDVEIYRLRKGGEDYHFAESHGIFLFSRHALFVEEAVRQIPADNLLDQEQFKNLYNTISGSSDFNVFIDHEKIHQFLGKAASPSFRQPLQLFSRFAHRTELDVTIRETEVLGGGFSFLEPAGHHYLRVFQDQEADRFNLEKMIPSRISGFLCLNLSDFEKYQNGYAEFLKGKQGSYYRREASLKTLDGYFEKPFIPLFGKIAGKEFAMVFAPVTQNEPAANRIFIAGVKSQSMARELLLPMLERYAKARNVGMDKLQSAYQVRSEQTVTIYGFPVPDFPGLLMGETFSAVESNYFCFYENYLIFSDNSTALKSYLHDLGSSNTLANDVRFRKFNGQMASKSTFYFFLNFSRAFYLKNHYLNGIVSGVLQDHEEAIRKFYGFGWQFSAASGEFLNNLYLKYDPVPKEEPQAVWQTRLDSSIAIPPQLMVNHYDKQNKEVIVQDSKDDLYLINHEGVSLWKVKLPGKILSEIYQIDYYRNGKLQYLFNTRDQLHLIDRNGSTVARFPVKLRAPSTNGVAVIDYDNKRDYRYFVAAGDGKIDAYARDGKMLGGWKFEGTDGVVVNPVRYFRSGSKDFLVCADQAKTYILDRQGNTRLNTTDHFEHSGNDVYLAEGAAPALVTTDTEGRVHLQYLDGKSDIRDLGRFGKDHYFVAADLNGDKKTDYLVADGNQLAAFTDQGKKMFQRKFDSVITAIPGVYAVGSGNRKIGVVCGNENRIYLIDHKGELYPGFPLPGNTAFTAGSLTPGNTYFNLLTGTEDGSFLHYKVE